MPTLKTKITTPHLNATKTFFESVLGLVVVEEWDEPNDRGVILEFESGSREALLEIYDGEATQDFSGLSLQFRVRSVDEVLNGLPEGIAYEGPTKRPWGSTYVYLEDPNGIQVIVYEGGW